MSDERDFKDEFVNDSSFKYSMVDEDVQNRQLRDKYNLVYSNMTKDVPYLEVIKMLEVKLFSAEASLKLANELNNINDEIIKKQGDMINSFVKHISE